MALGSVSASGSSIEKQLGIPNGVATLDGAGKLNENQRPEVDAYTKEQTDQRISSAVDTHDDANTAHPDIRVVLSQLNARLAVLELKLNTNVTQNPFSATFGSLAGLTVTGVWNESLARIEF